MNESCQFWHSVQKPDSRKFLKRATVSVSTRISKCFFFSVSAFFISFIKSWTGLTFCCHASAKKYFRCLHCKTKFPRWHSFLNWLISTFRFLFLRHHDLDYLIPGIDPHHLWSWWKIGFPIFFGFFFPNKFWDFVNAKHFLCFFVIFWKFQINVSHK